MESAAGFRPQAEEDEERFDVLDEDGNAMGITETRAKCHAEGIYHRAVYVFVVKGRKGQSKSVLLQQRSKYKRISPLCWDLSAAEHLSAGEDYSMGAVRGVQEELGLVMDSSALQGPLIPIHQRKLDLPRLGVKDYEYVTSYLVELQEDAAIESFSPNSNEIEALRWISLEELNEEISTNPEQFTPWLLAEVDGLRCYLQGLE